MTLSRTCDCESQALPPPGWGSQGKCPCPVGLDREAGRGPALGPKRRRGNKDATLPGPIQSGTASENSNPEAAGEGRTGWTTSLGNSGGGGGGGRCHTQTLDPANPPYRAQLPANRSTTASSLCSGWDGPGPGPAPQSVGMRGTPIRNEQRRTEWGEGRKARTEHRREGGARPPRQPPTEGEHGSQGRGGSREKDGGCSRAAVPAAEGGLPPRLRDGPPPSQAHTPLSLQTNNDN